MQNEIWMPVKGYEGRYEVSNLGRVKSLSRYHRDHDIILKQHINKRNGYCYVGLRKDNKTITRRVHKLVFEAFTGDICDGYDPQRTINHIDGDKTNNCIENLERVSSSENMIHAFRMGLELPPEGLKVICLDNMRVFDSLMDAARFAGSDSRNGGNLVARVCRGTRSHYRNHHFAFYDDYLNGTIPEYSGRTTRKASVSLWR